MAEELENSVREMLKKESWTRAGINDFTKNNLMELAETLEKARAENCEKQIKEICDEQLAHSKDSIVALYLSGMIALRSGDVDTSSLVTLIEIFEKNLKDSLVEYLCDSILEEDSQNKFALRKLAEFYKNSNNDKVWELYERIVKADFEEADIAKILAERYESQENKETAISYYKKALLRYVTAKNSNAVKEVWSKLVKLIPEDLDFFLRVERKVTKSINGYKAASLMQEVYQYYKDIAKWDTAISILKIILEHDPKDTWARKEITECYSAKYADHTHLEDYIRLSNLNQAYRDVFEAINDFEKHIAFDAKNFIFHRTWGVGKIMKVEGDMLTINFGKKTGVRQMNLEMAVKALQPLDRGHIWVLKATKKKEELVKLVKNDIEGTLKTIIRSFNNNCDDKRIKAELVPSILTQGEWTSWHTKAVKILESNPVFDVNPNDINFYTVRDHEISKAERLANEFKAEKNFFAKVDIITRYINLDDFDPTEEQFADMFSYFAGYVKAFSNITEQVTASFLIIQDITKKVPAIESPIKFSFADLYSEISSRRGMYAKLKDSKNTNLRQQFLSNVRQLEDWDKQYTHLFPVVLKKSLLDEMINAGKKDRVIHMVQNCFNEYRNYRDAAIYLYDQCRDTEWFKEAAVSEEKQLVTMVNIISLCYREINNHVNTVDNKKTIKNATTLLFADKVNGDVENRMLEFMLSKDRDTITRMYTMINDVRDLDSTFKSQLRNGILAAYPDFKFQETETKQEAPKGTLVTAKMLEIKRALAEDIEKVQLPKIAKEVGDAKEKGDLKENAEYISAREAQSRMNSKLAKLKEELARATVFDPTTVTTSFVSFGTTVTLFNNIEGKEEVLTILGPWESNSEEGIISYLSPLGDSLLNLKAGDEKTFTINDHHYDYTVKAIAAAKF
ncbi:transcription elongation factor GreA [Treponema rectale]|uniref:Transcription elongation factor GreA n=1 Tax=Treponema rectale TaxID=744512 RepID=A0A840SBJ0_9SPIR|nr:transcription elongation factor GreA [Treponema rectale]MBB5218080.1 transcription elongation factor GreA [Treponema rectale]QOS40206.1 transcription elongation factor GreA [Treponema rectale]